MIDWSKEIATKNYCGYCIGSPPSANCDGSCFKNSKENKIEHSFEMLKNVQNQIKELKKKEQLYHNEILNSSDSNSNFEKDEKKYPITPFTITISDSFCNWEYGFEPINADDFSIQDFVEAINKKFDTKPVYSKQIQ